MEETRLLRTLRSVRRFASTPIPEEVLRDILVVGRWTGSSKNTQPWEMIVVRDRAMLAALAQLGPYTAHLARAQAALVLVMDGPSGNEFDEGRLGQNLMLGAWAHGVGSCIGSIYPAEREAEARALLDVPDDRRVRTAISLGYPSEEARVPEVGRSRAGRGRKPLPTMVSWERYGRRTP